MEKEQKTYYISKSYEADPDMLKALEAKLKEKGHISLRFRGGNYNTFIADVYDRAKGFIAISHPNSQNDLEVICGRGVYSEFINFKKRGYQCMVYADDNKLYNIVDAERFNNEELKKDGSWQRRYATLKLKQNEQNM